MNEKQPKHYPFKGDQIVELTKREELMFELARVWNGRPNPELSAPALYHTMRIIDRTIKEVLDQTTLQPREKPIWRECRDVESWIERDSTTLGFNSAVDEHAQLKEKVIEKYLGGNERSNKTQD